MANVIAINCGHCGRGLKVTGDFAGKRVKCPDCAQPISVPRAAAAALPSGQPSKLQAPVSTPPSKPAGAQTRKPAAATATSRSSATTTPPVRRKPKRPVPQEEVLDEVEFLDDAEDAYEDYGDADTGDDDWGDDDWDDDDWDDDDSSDDDWDDRPRTSKRRTDGKSRGGRTSSRRGGNKKGRRQKQDTSLGGTNAGVLGGILMIVVAVVWFVGGLAFGYIFFYPPILLIIGIVAIIRGVMS